MDTIEWSSEYEIGIEVIDRQHQRIVEYINQLVRAQQQGEIQQVAETLDALVDYTHSHFVFEEALMEEAAYEFFGTHQMTHDRFIAKLNAFHTRYQQQENVAEELAEMLLHWLLNHIRHDDTSYAPVVKQQFLGNAERDSGGWIRQKLKQIFT